MPAIQYVQDHCNTAADVLAAARAVRERRQQSAKPSHVEAPRPIELVEWKKPAPKKEPEPYKYDNMSGYELNVTVLLNCIVWPETIGQVHFSILDIQREVCRQFKVSLEDLNGQQRGAWIMEPRHLAMVLSKHLTTRSLPEIGRRFGGRDHTTVLHAVRKYQWMIDRLESKDGAPLWETVAFGRSLMNAGP